MENANLFTEADALSVAIGEDLLAPPDQFARYETDVTGDYQGQARAVARPRNVEDVTAVVRWCRENHVPIVPFGGNTGLVGGAVPSPQQREVIMSLERLNRIRDIDALNGVAIVEAGCILEDVKTAVAAEGLYFPLAIGSQGSCQIGGAIATNAGGLNVVRYGMMRGLVLGLEVVLPDGRIFRDLRGLHKNNTGYDLKQLFIGSEGTLGIITAAAIRLVPAPTQIETAFLATTSVADMIKLFQRVRKDGGETISAFELMTNAVVKRVCATEEKVRNPLGKDYPAYAIVEMSQCGGTSLTDWFTDYLGTLIEDGLVLDGTIATNGTQTENIWAMRERIVESQAKMGVYLRTDLSTPISTMAEFITRGTALVQQIAPNALTLPYGHVGDGNIHFNVMRPLNITPDAFAPVIRRIETALFNLVDEFGGSISAEHGIGVAKQAAFEERIDPVARDLQILLKRTLDPENLLSPGRIISEKWFCNAVQS